jgi:hypothetical protein
MMRIASALLIVLACGSVAGACPMCRDAQVADGAGRAAASLFNGSILYMLLAFALVVAATAFKITATLRGPRPGRMNHRVG